MLGLSDWPVKSNHCEQTQQNPLLPPSSHQEVIPMATAGQFPLCTWGCSNFLKKPPFLAAFPSWLLKRDWMWCTMNAAWRQQPQPALYDWQWSLRGKERREKRPLRVFGASLSVSTELKFCLPPPPPSPISTDVAETLPGNCGQWLDTYSSSAPLTSISAPFFSVSPLDLALSIYWILCELAGHYLKTALECFYRDAENLGGGSRCMFCLYCQVTYGRFAWYCLIYNVSIL